MSSLSRRVTCITKLAPCMMMSPLSVAQYLPADTKPFDVVVFDEASQIPAWDAIGAIARGKQVIVVGDPKQLPPTAFFDRSSDGHDDAFDLEDLESILDECLAANIPHKRLAWHYRSRHESLIAFSNERYYDGRLVTFPSPVTDDRAVRYVHVPGGVYERGSGRVNREEARAVVRDVVRRLTDPTFAREGRSLGIVTFNTEQQRLIETLLDQERRAHPELESFFGTELHEPVFVKNLESVQGDERDVILFSVAYGPDAAGRVSAQISVLNKDGGARRLNVAITRARYELVVFATLRPEQINLSRTEAAGVRDFKHFLEYAERGPRALAEAAAPLDRDTDSPFEDAVRKALEERGWVVHPVWGWPASASISAWSIRMLQAAISLASSATGRPITVRRRRGTVISCGNGSYGASAGVSIACGRRTGGWMLTGRSPPWRGRFTRTSKTIGRRRLSRPRLLRLRPR